MATRTVALAADTNVNLSTGATLETGKTYLVECDGNGLANADALIALDAHPMDGGHPISAGDGGRLIYQASGATWWALSHLGATLVLTEADDAD